MPKLRRGRGGARGDLWTLAGGEDRVLQSFIAIGILPNPISSSSEVWSRLASVVFGQDSSNNRKWLYTTWTLNRKGIKTRVEATLQRTLQATGQILSASQEQHVEQNHQVNKKDDKETQTGTVSDQVKEESELELLNDDDRNDDIAKQGTESEDDSVDEQMYKNDDRETETDTKSESEDDADTEQVENNEKKTYIGTESEEEEDNYSEVVQGEIKSEKITQTGTDSEEEDDSEIEKFVDINDDREIQTGTESEESDSDVEQVEKKTVKVKQRGMESEKDEDSEVEQGKDDEESERTIESDESTMKVKEETSRYRKIPPMPSKFYLTKHKWLLIAPQKGNLKLATPWTNVLYNEIAKQHPGCVLKFTYHHIRVPGSRKQRAPYLSVHAVCKFSTCKARFLIKMAERPSTNQKNIKINIAVDVSVTLKLKPGVDQQAMLNEAI
ncbi:hypothetical protein KUCAC02_016454 [Chaenocephalus aceratus]|nr:hypothetical protein KUCAC02_016454 [Chaenocephalus aceratus]